MGQAARGQHHRRTGAGQAPDSGPRTTADRHRRPQGRPTVSKSAADVDRPSRRAKRTRPSAPAKRPGQAHGGSERPRRPAGPRPCRDATRRGRRWATEGGWVSRAGPAPRPRALAGDGGGGLPLEAAAFFAIRPVLRRWAGRPASRADAAGVRGHRHGRRSAPLGAPRARATGSTPGGSDEPRPHPAVPLTGMRPPARRVARSDTGEPITVIGQSLGGIYARLLARESPDAVRQVITLGSPYRMVEGDRSTARTGLWRQLQHLHNGDLSLMGICREQDRPPLQVPVIVVLFAYRRRRAVADLHRCGGRARREHRGPRVAMSAWASTPPSSWPSSTACRNRRTIGSRSSRRCRSGRGTRGRRTGVAPPEAAPSSERLIFDHAVASFDPTAVGVLLWTRFGAGAPRPTWSWRATPSCATSSPGVGVDRRRARPHRRRRRRRARAGDHLLVPLRGRRRALAGGRTRTLPGRTASSPSAIGTVCCARYSVAPLGVYRALAEREVDLVLHLGDYIYEDDGTRARATTTRPTRP